MNYRRTKFERKGRKLGIIGRKKKAYREKRASGGRGRK